MLPARRFHLPSSISHLLLALAFPLLVASLAFAQQPAVLNKTSLGKSNNTAEDLENSLIPGKPNLTKGEKKSEVDPKKLPSKSAKDPLFQGGLMDVNVDWTGGDKLGKPRGSQGANSTAGGRESSAEREAGNASPARTSVSGETSAANESDPKVAAKNADPARDKDSKPSKSDAADAGQNKEQNQNSAKSADKQSAKESPSAAKPDADR